MKEAESGVVCQHFKNSSQSTRFDRREQGAFFESAFGATGAGFFWVARFHVGFLCDTITLGGVIMEVNLSIKPHAFKICAEVGRDDY